MPVGRRQWRPTVGGDRLRHSVAGSSMAVIIVVDFYFLSYTMRRTPITHRVTVDAAVTLSSQFAFGPVKVCLFLPLPFLPLVRLRLV
jgi:hypothetical protein